MSYRLGIDVGGTFTDLLLVDEKTGRTWSAKVPSTPKDQSVGVLAGLTRVCRQADIKPAAIEHVMHGTTVATNTVLTSSGAKVGLVTTKGYRQVLQIARSYVPGGLGGWVIYNKSLPMAPLEVRTVLVATVVPCITCEMLLGSMSFSRQSLAMPLMTPIEESCGVDGTLAEKVRPLADSISRRSVNVPPTSTPSR